jgi:hypothetical protein
MRTRDLMGTKKDPILQLCFCNILAHLDTHAPAHILGAECLLGKC